MSSFKIRSEAGWFRRKNVLRVFSDAIEKTYRHGSDFAVKVANQWIDFLNSRTIPIYG